MSASPDNANLNKCHKAPTPRWKAKGKENQFSLGTNSLIKLCSPQWSALTHCTYMKH